MPSNQRKRRFEAFYHDMRNYLSERLKARRKAVYAFIRGVNQTQY